MQGVCTPTPERHFGAGYLVAMALRDFRIWITFAVVRARQSRRKAISAHGPHGFGIVGPSINRKAGARANRSGIHHAGSWNRGLLRQSVPMQQG